MNNTKPQLDTKQIQYLLDYTKNHNILYKDVQLELVDHLASGVEDIMSEEKDITFNKALYKFTGTLPRDFYYRFIEEKSKALNGFWKSKMSKYLLGFLTIPKCIITCLIFLLYFKSHFLFPPLTIYLIYGVTVLIMSVIHIMKVKVKYNLKDQYLIIKTYSDGINLLAILLFSIPFNIGIQVFIQNSQSMLGVIFLSFAITSGIIFTYASNFVFPSMLKDDIDKKYAHLNISLI